MLNELDKELERRGLQYVRYADDWLVGVCGTKEECIALKAEIAEYLNNELKLTLSEEKTLITHSSEKVRFLGYDICVRKSGSCGVFGRSIRNVCTYSCQYIDPFDYQGRI